VRDFVGALRGVLSNERQVRGDKEPFLGADITGVGPAGFHARLEGVRAKVPRHWSDKMFNSALILGEGLREEPGGGEGRRHPARRAERRLMPFGAAGLRWAPIRDRHGTNRGLKEVGHIHAAESVRGKEEACLWGVLG
jgi:hypothetical protein